LRKHDFMLIQRSPEPETAGAEVANEVVEAAQIEQPASEPETVEQENDEPYFSFDDDDPAEPIKPEAEGGAPSAVVKTVPESEYNKIILELNALKVENEQIKSQLSHPLVQAAQEYAEAQGVGVELDPVDFIHSTFGLDTKRLTDEEVVLATIKRDAQSLNVTLSEDELEDEFQSRWADIEQKGKLKGPAELKKMREDLQGDSKGKLKEVVDAKKIDIQKAQEFWQTQYKRVEDTFADLKKTGKKEFGLKMPVDDSLVTQAQTAINNSYIRFNDKGDVDVNHAIEVAIFSANPRAYIKRIEDAAMMKAKRESLKARSSGSMTTPTGMPISDPLRDAPTEMSAWDIKNAKPIGTIRKV